MTLVNDVAATRKQSPMMKDSQATTLEPANGSPTQPRREITPKERLIQEYRGAAHSWRTPVPWRDRSSANRENLLSSTLRRCCAHCPIADRDEGVVDTLV